MYIPVCHVQYQGHENVLQLSYVRLDLFYSFVLYHIIFFFFFIVKETNLRHFLSLKLVTLFIRIIPSLFLTICVCFFLFLFLFTDNVCKYEVFIIKVIQRIIVMCALFNIFLFFFLKMSILQ